ncbi:threonine/serine exporter family protein [Streptomyces sp. NBS 14/10]|uniref:threonine/serine ThrE exporter family protein n=1 Tax=Streptomyces sp. NBS 14/10 TaxID=1945643 RepID=UPI000B7DDB8B|nr:threonine/serine exporter family protein [Streptomyces sp. NBS 14/10]KAK1180257.1 threonine/serine exporter family protein [Streptomyces sp. NBS 14/10]
MGSERQRGQRGASVPEAEAAGSRKPQSDEAHSAFTPPLGMPLPPVPEDDHPTSEFAVPEGLGSGRSESATETDTEGSAFVPPAGVKTGPQNGQAANFPAFTPPNGIPAIQLTNEGPWQDRMRAMLRMPISERPVPERQERQDEAGPAVPRVLDLILRIGELLLAGGEGAEDVEAAMFGVAHAYGLDRCEPTVTFTLLSVSYQPSLVDDPVTASRTVRRRGTDYTRLSAVFRLVDDITSGEDFTLEEAYRRLAEIRRNRHPYPGWALTLAGGALAGAASMLVGGDWPVFFAAAVGAMLGDRLAWLASGRGLPEFYQFVAAAMPPAAMGVALSLAGVGLQSSAVITGGLFALIPGRALVAGVQDGLTGYYITAAARLLEVVYLIVGIVCGVLTVLYGGLQLDAKLNPEAALRQVDRPAVQIVAAMLLALTFSILLQQERHTVLFVTLNGGVAWVVYGALHNTAGVPAVAATTVAAGLVGLFGQMLSRYRYASALPYVTAAIGPLLPGSATYFGLLALAQGNLDRGIAHLTQAAALALAIAIGVNLGNEAARLFLKAPRPETEASGRRAAKRTRGF